MTTRQFNDGSLITVNTEDGPVEQWHEDFVPFEDEEIPLYWPDGTRRRHET